MPPFAHGWSHHVARLSVQTKGAEPNPLSPPAVLIPCDARAQERGEDGLFLWERVQLTCEPDGRPVLQCRNLEDSSISPHVQEVSLRGLRSARSWADSSDVPAFGGCGFDIEWAGGSHWSLLADSITDCQTWVARLHELASSASSDTSSDVVGGGLPSRAGGALAGTGSNLDDELRAARRRIDEIAGRAAAIVASADARADPMASDIERRLTPSEAWTATPIDRRPDAPDAGDEARHEIERLKQLHEERVSKVRDESSPLLRVAWCEK